MVLMGIDWGEEHHDVCLVDVDGKTVTRKRVPDGLAGVTQIHELVAKHAAEGEPVCVGIEIDHGLLVQALVAAGYEVYAINPMAVSRMVELQIRLLNRLNAAGVRQFLSSDCVNGECADSMRALLTSPYPSHIPYTSIYSKTDGVVDWRACCDPDAELVEVRASHFQLGVDPRVMRLVGERFDVLERADQSAAS